MCLVVVTGVLAAVILPAYEKLRMHRVNAEAIEALDLLARASAAYVTNSSSDGRAMPEPPYGFPSRAEPTPPARCCLYPGGRCPYDVLNWDATPWRELDFEPVEPHRFQYAYESAGVGPGAIFTARALGDLDCDGVLSTFERCGIVASNFGVRLTDGVFVVREGE
jgi:hypothetical protein